MASLGQIKDPRSLDPLVSALGDGNRSLREEAGWAIRSVAGAGSTDLLIRILADGNIIRRMGAIDALGNSGDMKAVPPLIGVLEYGCRCAGWAVESLGRLKDNRSITPLIKHLQDPEVNVRGEARRALVAIGEPGEEALISALKDGDNTTRAGVAVVLGEIGDERSTEPLLLAFQNGTACETRCRNCARQDKRSRACSRLSRFCRIRVPEAIYGQMRPGAGRDE